MLDKQEEEGGKGRIKMNVKLTTASRSKVHIQPYVVPVALIS